MAFNLWLNQVNVGSLVRAIWVAWASLMHTQLHSCSSWSKQLLTISRCLSCGQKIVTMSVTPPAFNHSGSAKAALTHEDIPELVRVLAAEMKKTTHAALR